MQPNTESIQINSTKYRINSNKDRIGPNKIDSELIRMHSKFFTKITKNDGKQEKMVKNDKKNPLQNNCLSIRKREKQSWCAVGAGHIFPLHLSIKMVVYTYGASSSDFSHIFINFFRYSLFSINFCHFSSYFFRFFLNLESHHWSVGIQHRSVFNLPITVLAFAICHLTVRNLGIWRLTASNWHLIFSNWQFGISV